MDKLFKNCNTIRTLKIKHGSRKKAKLARDILETNIQVTVVYSPDTIAIVIFHDASGTEMNAPL